MTGELRALEFFAGIGLARMGLERAGFRVVFANDIDPKKLQMHEGHWGPDPSYHLGDVFELEASTLPDAELAWASFPCVDLSLAGNRAGLNGKSSGAYWGFYRLLESFETANRPSMVVLENVAGMLTSRGGADLRVILDGLNNGRRAIDRCRALRPPEPPAAVRGCRDFAGYAAEPSRLRRRHPFRSRAALPRG